MPILVACDCGKKLKAPDAAAGKRAKCPGCGKVLAVPAAAGSIDAATPSSAKAPASPSTSRPAPPQAASNPGPSEPASSSPPAAPHAIARASNDYEISLDLGALAATDPAGAMPRRVELDAPEAAAADTSNAASGSTRLVPKPPKEAPKHDFTLGTFMGIDMDVGNLIKFAILAVFVVAGIWGWRRLTTDFRIASAVSVDAVPAYGVAFKSKADWKLLNNSPNERLVDLANISGDVVASGPDIIYVTRPDPKGEYILMDVVVSQQLLHEQKQETGIYMIVDAAKFELKSASGTVVPHMIIMPVKSGFELDTSTVQTADPAGILPPNAKPSRSDVQPDRNTNGTKGTLHFDGSGYQGELTYSSYHYKAEFGPDSLGVDATGRLKFTSAQSMPVNYSYNRGLAVSWPDDAEGWCTMRSFMVEKGHLYAKFPVKLIFPKPKGGGVGTIVFAGREVGTINLDKVTSKTPERPDASKPGGFEEPVTSYLQALADGRKKAQGMVSDIYLRELHRCLFTYVEEHNGEWPENWDELDRAVPGVKAVLARNPRQGTDGYVYVKPARKLGDLTDPSSVIVIYESKNGKPDPDGDAIYADGRVAKPSDIASGRSGVGGF